MPSESAIPEAQTNAVEWLRLLRDDSPYEVFLGSDGLPIVQGDSPHMPTAAQRRQQHRPAPRPAQPAAEIAPVSESMSAADALNMIESGAASAPVAERWSHMEGLKVKPGKFETAATQPTGPLQNAASVVQKHFGNMLGNHAPGDAAPRVDPSKPGIGTGLARQEAQQYIDGDPGTGYIQSGGQALPRPRNPAPQERDWSAPEEGVDVHSFRDYVFIGRDAAGLTIYASPNRYRGVELVDAARLEFNKQ